MQSQATYNYKVVRQFAIMTVVWGIVGMLVGVIAAAQLVWPELNVHEFLHFGRLRPLHTNAVIFAFGGCALFATSYYVVQRTGHTPADSWMVGDHHTDLEAARRALKPGGRACLIYPCSRMVEAVHGMRSLRLEPKRFRMVHSPPGSRGDFILVGGVKGGGEELAVLPPLYIYRQEGSYSDEMEHLFREISAPAE